MSRSPDRSGLTLSLTNNSRRNTFRGVLHLLVRLYSCWVRSPGRVEVQMKYAQNVRIAGHKICWSMSRIGLWEVLSPISTTWHLD